MFDTLAFAVHLAPPAGSQVTAHSDLGNGLLVVLAAIAVLCVSLVGLTYLEPKNTTLQPPPGPPARPAPEHIVPSPRDSSPLTPVGVLVRGRRPGRP